MPTKAKKVQPKIKPWTGYAILDRKNRIALSHNGLPLIAGTAKTWRTLVYLDDGERIAKVRIEVIG